MKVENSFDKKTWTLPEIYVLDFKQTKGGPQFSDYEDAYEYNEFSPPPDE